MSRKEVRFDMQTAVRISGVLAGLKPLGEEDVERWLQFWKDAGFLNV